MQKINFLAGSRQALIEAEILVEKNLKNSARVDYGAYFLKSLNL